MSMTIFDLVHNRILVAEKETGTYARAQVVKEYRVMEVSPSGGWVKLMDSDGRKYWRSVGDIKPIEVLALLEKPTT